MTASARRSNVNVLDLSGGSGHTPPNVDVLPREQRVRRNPKRERYSTVSHITQGMTRPAAGHEGLTVAHLR
jgi:hypothetical protein